MVDHVSDIAAVAKRAGACLHVDACLGGFVLPFARQLGYKVGCLPGGVVLSFARQLGYKVCFWGGAGELKGSFYSRHSR